MHQAWRTSLLASAALWVAGGAAAQEAVGDLALRRVMLSTGGVGYFEYEAEVVGDADLSLEVRLDQVDDVLKSIVVYDDQGGIGEISLPGQEPLREVFRELPFTPDDLSSPAALLNALRGSEVRAVGAREVVGRILSVTQEVVALPNGQGTVTQHRLSLMTAIGVRQVILEETDRLEFTDPELQAQLDNALAAMAELNQRDRRTLSIDMAGEGTRTVRVAYVVEVPLWKSTYRLTMSAAPESDAADAQGWAVLENLSGEDWQDVELSIVSGNPVTFRQALYAAYNVARPEVPVEVLGRVLPQVNTGSFMRDQEMAAAEERSFRMAEPMAEFAPMAPAGAAIADGMFGQGPGNFANLTAAESTEATTQVVFRLPEPISVQAGHSVLVPIIERTVPAERLALYQPETHATHPLATVRLDNDSSTGLPPGVLTLYEREVDTGVVSFVGDARLGAFPAGEERLISYAVDQKVRVDREYRSSQTLARGRIVNGQLELTLTERQSTIYTIVGAAREPRTVLIEHPRMTDWRLVQPAESTVELTETDYRIPAELEAGETETLEVRLERPLLQVIDLVSMSLPQIEYYAAATELPADVRQAVARLADFSQAIADAQQKLSELEIEQRRIVVDQERIRGNLQSVPRDSDIYQRYLTTLSSQEDRLESLTSQIGEARAALNAARQALGDYVKGLTI